MFFNKNQLTTIIDFILGPLCVMLGLTDATHNAILNILLILIPVIGTWLSEKYPDNTIIRSTSNEQITEDPVEWITPEHNLDDENDGI